MIHLDELLRQFGTITQADRNAPAVKNRIWIKTAAVLESAAIALRQHALADRLDRLWQCSCPNCETTRDLCRIVQARAGGP